MMFFVMKTCAYVQKKAVYFLFLDKVTKPVLLYLSRHSDSSLVLLAEMTIQRRCQEIFFNFEHCKSFIIPRCVKLNFKFLVIN